MKLNPPKNSNYAALVVEIKTIIPLEGCNNVQAAIILGNQVIIGKDVTIGTIGLYFPLECQLSSKYMSVNNLYRNQDLNVDNTQKGYFDENGRVRCQKFVKRYDSEGFFMPINSIEFTGVLASELKIGDEFDELNGITICSKYIVKNTKTQGQPNKNEKSGRTNVKMKDKLVDKQFKFHEATSILYKNVNRITPDSLIQISYKEHGCVSHDTIINTLQGDFTIKEIVDKKLDVDVKAFDINTGEIVYVPIDEYYFLENDGEWYEVELEDGTKLNITGNNPVWLPELSCYRKTNELISGDSLLID